VSYLQGVVSAFKPHDVNSAGLAECSKAVDVAYDLINTHGAMSDLSGYGTMRIQAADVVSDLIEGYIDMSLYNTSTMASVLTINDTQSSDIIQKANMLTMSIAEVMTAGDETLKVLCSTTANGHCHLNVAAHYDLNTDLMSATITPPRSDDQATFDVDQFAITLPSDGLTRCLETAGDQHIKFGLLEFGISPVPEDNTWPDRNNMDSVYSEMVMFTMAMPDTTPAYNDASEYSVTIFFQDSMEGLFNFTSFNRTIPSTLTFDGYNFISSSCNITEYNNYNATFNCPDTGRLCSANTDNSGYEMTVLGETYMVNTITGGTEFLEGLVTVAPTGMPTGEPTGQPTQIPTGHPTIVPTHPTSQPTGQPSSMPTYMPSSMPTSMPSRAQFSTVVLPVTTTIQGPIDAATFNTTENVLAFRFAVANITSNLVSYKDIEVTDISDETNRRRMNAAPVGDRRLSVIGVIIKYEITFIAEDIEDSASLTSVASAVQLIKDLIEDSTQSVGSSSTSRLIAAIRAAASTLGAASTATLFANTFTVTQDIGSAVITVWGADDSKEDHPFLWEVIVVVPVVAFIGLMILLGQRVKKLQEKAESTITGSSANDPGLFQNMTGFLDGNKTDKPAEDKAPDTDTSNKSSYSGLMSLFRGKDTKKASGDLATPLSSQI